MPCNKVILTKQEAEKALKIISHKGSQHQKEKRMYYCRNCQGWHLTSQENKFIKEEAKPVQLVYKDRWKALLNGNVSI